MCFHVRTLSLPAASKVNPSSDNAIEVTVELCPLKVEMHFLVRRFHTRTVPSSLPENSFPPKGDGKIKSAQRQTAFYGHGNELFLIIIFW